MTNQASSCKTKKHLKHTAKRSRMMATVLTVCMVFTAAPSAAFAAGCTNHEAHDDCGYTEAVAAEPCGHLSDDGYSCIITSDDDGTPASPSDAAKGGSKDASVCTHDDGCGYEEAVEGSLCTHECELCRPGSEEPKDEKTEGTLLDAGADSRMNTKETPITSEELLLAALAAASNGDTITLGGDIEMAGTFETGKSLTLDGGGYTVTRSESTVTGPMFRIAEQGVMDQEFTFQNITIDGNKENIQTSRIGVSVGSYSTVIFENGTTVQNCTSNGVNTSGTFVMKDGSSISDNKAVSGAGVYMDQGQVTMEAGSTIANNQATKGAGVYLTSTNRGTFHMEGGSITGNDVTDPTGQDRLATGAGVYIIGGTFHMSGGEISGNTAPLFGSGVYYVKGGTGSLLELSGTPRITDNFSKRNKKDPEPDNLYIDGPCMAISDELMPGALIGVSMIYKSPGSSPRDITEASSTDYSAYFSSDSIDYSIENVDRDGGQILQYTWIPYPQDELDAVAAADSAVVDTTLTVLPGATRQEKLKAVKAYVESKLTGEADGVTYEIYGMGGTDGSYEVTLTKGRVSKTKDIFINFNEDANVDNNAVEAAKFAAERAVKAFKPTNSTTADDILNLVKQAVAELPQVFGVATAWKPDSGFQKTDATADNVGTITGTILITKGNASSEYTISLRIDQLEQQTYQFTVKLNGGEDSFTKDHIYPAGSKVDIYAGTRAGYSFSGWTSDVKVDFEKQNASQTSFTMPASDVTVQANWTANGGGDIPVEPDTPDHNAVNAAATAAAAALEAMTVTNDTTAEDVLGAAMAAMAGDDTAHGVTAAWKQGHGFQKINSSKDSDGSITGTITLTKNAAVVEREINLIIDRLAPKTYHISINMNGSTGGFGSGSYTSGSRISINAGTKTGYSFSGWTSEGGGSFDQPNKPQTTFTVPAHDVTISANWTYNGGSGNNSGGGDGGGSSSDTGTGISITPPSAANPNAPVQAVVNAAGQADANGHVSVSVSQSAVNDAINQAMAVADKYGTTAGGVSLVLNVAGAAARQTAGSAAITLPKSVQDTLTGRGVTNTVIAVSQPSVNIGLDLNTLKEINQQAQGDINLAVTSVSNDSLIGNAKNVIASRPVLDLKLNFGDGKQMANLGTNAVNIGIPYTLQEGELPENICAVSVDAAGNVTYLTDSVYDAQTKTLSFKTNTFAVFGVGTKAATP